MERKSHSQQWRLSKALIAVAIVGICAGTSFAPAKASTAAIPGHALTSSGTTTPSTDFSPGCTFVGLAFPSPSPANPCVPPGTSTMTVTPSPGLVAYPESFQIAINNNVVTNLPNIGYVNPQNPDPWNGGAYGAPVPVPSVAPHHVNWNWSSVVVDFEPTGSAPWNAHTTAEYQAAGYTATGASACSATYPSIGTLSYAGATTSCTTILKTSFTPGLSQDTVNVPYSYRTTNSNYTPFLFVNWNTPMPYSAQYPCGMPGYSGSACPVPYATTAPTTYTPYSSFGWKPDIVTNITHPYTSHTAVWAAVGYVRPGPGADLGTRWDVAAHDIMNTWATGSYDTMPVSCWDAAASKWVGCGYHNEAAACPGGASTNCPFWWYRPICSSGGEYGNSAGPGSPVVGDNHQCWVQVGGSNRSNGTYYPPAPGCYGGLDNSQTSSSQCQYSTDSPNNLNYNESDVSRNAAAMVTEYDLHPGTPGVYGTTAQSYAMGLDQTSGYNPYCSDPSNLSDPLDWTSGIAGVGSLTPGCVPNASTTPYTIVRTYNNQYWGTTPSTTPLSYDNNSTAEDNQTLNTCANGSGLLHCQDIHTVNTWPTGNYKPIGAKQYQDYFTCSYTNNFADDTYDDNQTTPNDTERPAGSQSETGISDAGQSSQAPISNYYGWNTGPGSGSCTAAETSYYDYGTAYPTNAFWYSSDVWLDANTVNDAWYSADCMSDTSPTTVGTPGPGGVPCPTAATKNYNTPAWQSFPQLCSGVGAGNPESISDPGLMNSVRSAHSNYMPDNNPSAAPYSPIPLESGAVSAPSPVNVTAPACQFPVLPPILNVFSPQGQSITLSIDQEQPVQGMLLHGASGSVTAVAGLAPRRRPV